MKVFNERKSSQNQGEKADLQQGPDKEAGDKAPDSLEVLESCEIPDSPNLIHLLQWNNLPLFALKGQEELLQDSRTLNYTNKLFGTHNGPSCSC